MKKIEISKSYLSRKGLTYEKLNTVSEDWKAAQIIGFVSSKQPIYFKGNNLTGELYERAITQYDGHGCELCGCNSVKYRHVLINDKAKLYMQVGSECINQHHGKVVRKEYKIFKDNETRKKANLFLKKFIKWSDTQKQFKHPKNTFEKNRLIYEVYLELIKARKLLKKFDTISIRKLNNFMKKHKDFETIPPVNQYDEFIGISNIDDLILNYENGELNRKLDFGKHKGKILKDVPMSYIDWAMKKLNS